MKTLITIALTTGILMGCTTGTIITQEGSTEQPKWHNAEKVIFNKDLGTFANLQSLNQIREGMTKDQLYELIGRPHYDDGWRPREWNYLFHFNTPGQGENDITTCQYKVLFDKNMYARSFYWNPINPKDGLCPPTLKSPVKDSITEKISIKRYNFEADALFTFDKSGLDDLNLKGRQNLNQLVLDLGQLKEINFIRIIGYTDRLGTDKYNLKLSQNRAETIRQYFIQRGVAPNLITSQGLGNTGQIKQCNNNLSRNDLIACLKPNRRVEIEINGYGE